MRGTFALTMAGLAMVAAAQTKSPVGTWTGRVKVTKAAMPPNATPEQKAQMAAYVAAVEKTPVKLTVEAKNAFTLYTPPLTLPGGATMDAQTTKGKWKWVGRRLQITLLDDKGKEAVREFATMTADGRRIVLIPNPKNTMGQGVRITFTRD